MAERDESDESKPEPAGGDVAADATGQAREQAGEEAAAREAAAREEIAPHQATDGETPLRPEVDDEPIREPEEATADADPPADAEPPTDANPPADGGPRGDVDLPPPPAAAPRRRRRRKNIPRLAASGVAVRRLLSSRSP